MISTSYRVEFPPDVTVGKNGLHDGALDQSYPLNNSARMFLTLLRDGIPMTQIINSVAARFEKPRIEVERDLLGLVGHLNAAELVNIVPTGMVDTLRRFLWIIAFVATTRGFPPSFGKRAHVDSNGPMRVVASVLRAVLGHALPAVIVALCAIVALAGLTEPAFALALLVVAVSMLAALALHETGHALAIHLIGGRCYLIMAGVKVAVVHNRPSSPIVHAGGPLLVGGVGIGMALIAHALHSVPLAVASLPLVIQIVSLTAFSRDGRSLIESLTRT